MIKILFAASLVLYRKAHTSFCTVSYTIMMNHCLIILHSSTSLKTSINKDENIVKYRDPTKIKGRKEIAKRNEILYKKAEKRMQ